jgi:glycosyltransferase involved in cell wall biosynthesis
MPFRNSEKTISQAIRSILGQTFEDFELLLYDDGSTDKGGDIARSFLDGRILHYSDGERRYLARRLNESIARARGVWFARMDADDIAYPNRLALQIELLESEPCIDLCGGQAIVFAGDGSPLWHYLPPTHHKAIISSPARGFPIWHPTWVGKASWFRRWGYEETARLGQDQELLLRAYRDSVFANLPSPILGYRQERVSLKKLLRYKALWCRHFFHHRGSSMTVAEHGQFLAVQGIRLTANCLSVLCGARHVIGKQRAQPLTRSTAEEWSRVWQLMSDTTQAACSGASANEAAGYAGGD